MPEEVPPKLFDAFYRSDPARRNPAGGSGLGLALGLSGRFDLILLDLMLPVVDGFTVCRKLQEEIDTPILMVTARREDVDKIRGLGLGADDYIEKPFLPSVLAARVKAHLARYERLTGGLSLHTGTRRLYVEGREVELKNKEYELLLFFLLHVDTVFSREELYEKIRGLEAMGDNATVASWLCYYRALQDGPASVVVPTDKLSILVTVAFSGLMFHERLNRRAAGGFCW